MTTVKIGAVYYASIPQLSMRIIKISTRNDKHNSMFMTNNFPFFIDKLKRLEEFDNIRSGTKHVGVMNDDG